MKKKAVLAVCLIMIGSYSLIGNAEEQYADFENEYVDSYQIYQGETVEVEEEQDITEHLVITEESPSWDYTFTAPRDGLYYVGIDNLRDNTEVDFSMKDSWDNSSRIYSDGKAFEAREGDTYSFTIEQYKGNTDLDFTLSMQQPTLEISENVTKVNDRVKFSSQENWYTYQAPESGSYQFEVNCDAANATVTTYIFASDGSRINNCYDENQYSETISLDKDQTYTIVVEQCKGFGPYSVYIGVAQPVTDITGYTSVSDKFEYVDQYNMYRFTAPADGIYEWSYSTVSGDYFYSMNMWKDDGTKKEDVGFDTSYVHTIRMNKGETYYLRVQNYLIVYYVGEYTINIKYPAGTDLTEIPDSSSETTSDNEKYTDQSDDEDKQRIAELESELENLQNKYDHLLQIIGDSGVEISDVGE